MRKIYYFFLFASLIFFENCASFSKVYSEEEPGINMHKYHTYNWLDNSSIKQGNQGPELLTLNTQNKIRSAVEEQMNGYGFKPCTDQPDLILHYHVVIKNEVLYVHDWSCGGQGEGRSNYDRCNRVQRVHYREGTFIIDVIDTKSGNQVWRGVAISVLDNIDPNEMDKRVKAAVQAVFKKFPEKPLPRV